MYGTRRRRREKYIKQSLLMVVFLLQSHNVSRRRCEKKWFSWWKIAAHEAPQEQNFRKWCSLSWICLMGNKQIRGRIFQTFPQIYTNWIFCFSKISWFSIYANEYIQICGIARKHIQICIFRIYYIYKSIAMVWDASFDRQARPAHVRRPEW
jgi:hypothetical protein